MAVETPVGLEQALTCIAAVTPENLDTFRARIEPVWIEEALHATGTATLRRRRLPAEQVIWLVVGMALHRNRPIAEVVRHLELALPGRGKVRSVAPSTVSQARARLGADPVEWLFLRTGTQWAHESAARQRWRGLALYGVDGSTLRVPDTDENRRHFGGQAAGGDRGVSGYPLLRLVTLMALRSHLLVSANFGPYGVDERTYAEALWEGVPDDTLTLVDRNYLQANVLVSLTRRGTNRHWMTRAKSNSKWRVVEKLGPGDDLVEFTVSGEAHRQDPSLPKTFRARVIRYQRKGFRPQTLVTSLTEAKRYPADELRLLYHERWELELGYDEIKTEMLQREETIRSKGPVGVAQELFGLLLAYNLVRLEMERIADETGVEPLQISFVAALRFVVDEWHWSTITASPGAIPRHLEEMRDKIRRFVLPPRRPERSFPRAVKLKMSNYQRKRPTSRGKRPK
jgi:hypothetical protein